MAAGLPTHTVLLEEPQAAVYAWLVDQGDPWRKRIAVGDRLLVCDVGGGTTDLTLIDVAQQDGELALQRLAVGNHLLVGGDNMDLALAHQLADGFQQQGVSLDPWQAVSLWHACRAAKETLLADGGPPSQKVSVLGRSSRLIGGTVSIELERAKAATVLNDGFFPACNLEDRPARRRQSGFVQLGLPFETDTAITRHIAAFLGAHATEGEAAARPSHVLFNGGVFRAAGLRHRLLQVLEGWFPGTRGAGPDRTRRSGFRRRPRGGLLWLDEAAGRSADPRWNSPVVLHWNRDIRVGNSRSSATVARRVCCALRDGGGHAAGCSFCANWPVIGRAGPISLLQFIRSEAGSAWRRAGPVERGGAAGDGFDGSDPACQRGDGRQVCPRAVPVTRHRTGCFRIVVCQHPITRPLETRIQRSPAHLLIRRIDFQSSPHSAESWDRLPVGPVSPTSSRFPALSSPQFALPLNLVRTTHDPVAGRYTPDHHSEGY